MTTLVEGDLQLELPDTVMGRRFDDAGHGLSHCMSAVDWIVELAAQTCFVEVKDPDAPTAAGRGQRDEFVESFRSGNLDRKLSRRSSVTRSCTNGRVSGSMPRSCMSWRPLRAGSWRGAPWTMPCGSRGWTA